MSAHVSPLFDDRIADWLEDDPAVAPGELLQTVMAALPSIPQRRSGSTSWPRFLPAGTGRWLAAALVAAALLGIVAYSIGGPRATPRPTPTPPQPTPLGMFDLTGTWVEFTSQVYGYSVDIPSPWSVREASLDLGELGPPWINSLAVDYMAFEPVGSVTPGMIIGASPLTPGRSLAEWTNLTTVQTCGPPPAQAPIVIDGETGTLLEYPTCFDLHHLWATVLHGGKGYHIVWIGRPGSELADRRVFDLVVSTFQFPQP